MAVKAIIFSKDVQYEIVNGVQIILYHVKHREYVLVDGISYELVVSLINLQKIDYAEFLDTYSEKYSKHPNIKKKIINLLKKLQKLLIIKIQ